MSMTDPIKVEGLRQFVKDLKTIDRELPKMLRKAFNAAADIVVQDTRPRVPSRSGRAKGSIRAASTQTRVRVKAGGRRAPYYPWLDFGGRVGRNKSIRRPFYKEGRYLYNTYTGAKQSGEFRMEMEKAMISVIESAGIRVD